MDDLTFKSSWCLRIGIFESFYLLKGLSPQNCHLESGHGQWQTVINSWPLRFVPVLNVWWFYDPTAVSWPGILCSFNVFCGTAYAYVIGKILQTSKCEVIFFWLEKWHVWGDTTKYWKRCCKDLFHNLSTQTP